MTKKILVAEDEPHIIECLDYLLGRAGYTMTSVTDGLSVFKAIAADPPSLLILDIMLPEMNGFDILRRLREHNETRSLPVLVLTAKGQESDRHRILELGANAFVTKPFSNKDLMDNIEGLITNNQMENPQKSSRRSS